VKKVGLMKVIHEKYKGAKNSETIEEFHAEFNEAMKFNKDIRPHLSKAQVRSYCLLSLQISTFISYHLLYSFLRSRGCE
jgi:DNA-directed RNA polymerase III subunit RPC1